MTSKAFSKAIDLTLIFAVLAATVLLISCAPAAYRVESRPVSEPAALKPPPVQVYFYPKAGQTEAQQDRDRYECFNWSVKQTGFDPSTAQLTPEQRVTVTPVPAPGHDTAVGAIAGGAIGALAAGPHHAPGGLLIGAAVGALAGAMSDSAKQETARRMEESYNRRSQAYDGQLERRALEFRRAMTACLEGRGYTVK